MNNTKLFHYISFIFVILLVLSSVAFGANDLSQSELDDLISRVEKGEPYAQFELGLVYYNGQNVNQDYEQAIYWFKKAAENGIVEAQHNLGIIYYNGLGTKQDYEQAFYWFKKAAEQNYAISQDSLGIMYKNGLGTKKNTEQALFWYKKAAENGNAEAQGNLGVMYWNGEDIMQDREQALYWLKKASENGNEEAKELISRIKITFVDANQPLNTKAQQDTAFQIRQIEDALALYRLHNGFYPSTEQGLQALVTLPTSSPVPNHYQEGGYLKRLPNDAWGNPYIYKNYGKEVQIISYGRDGKKGGEGLDANIKNIEVRYEIEDAKQDNTKSEVDEIIKGVENGTGHEAMIDSICNVARNLVKGKSPQFQKSATMEAFEGPMELHLRLWTAEHYAVLMNYEDETWKKGYIIGVWTDDPSLIFAHKLKVGASLNDVKTFYNYQGEDDGTLYSSEDGSEWYSYLERSTVAFAIKDWNVESIRYVSLITDVPPEIKQAVTGTILKAEPLQLATEQTAENDYNFEKKIIELADKISSANQYSYQDVELVEGNTMVPDEIVYMRAWKGKGYFFIRNYENKSWSKNQLTHFYLNDKSNVNFSGRIKIGCTLDDLTAVFGDNLEWSGSDRPSEWTLTTDSERIINFYVSSKGYVHEIHYTTVGSITSKMSLLYAFNSGELLAADVTGQKVNIRDFPDTSGTNVVFQANKSKKKKDVLLVIDKANSHANGVYNNISDEWYRVVGRISGNKFIPVEGEAYVIYKYVNIRPMSNVERNMVSSALN